LQLLDEIEARLIEVGINHVEHTPHIHTTIHAYTDTHARPHTQAMLEFDAASAVVLSFAGR
jgi:hypothetical protein